MNLKDSVASELQKLIDGGKVEELIEKQLTSTVTDILNETLRGYSDFGKALKSKIEECVMLPLERVTMPTYAAMMEKSIMEVLEGSIMQDSIGPVKEVIRKYVTALDKKEWKLSEIINIIGEDYVGDWDGEDKSCEIELRISKHATSSEWIYIETPDHRYTLAIHNDDRDNELWNFSIDGKRFDPRRSNMYQHTIDAFLFNLYACRAKIIIDESHCELYFSNSID